jgi:hypothetical protein
MKLIVVNHANLKVPVYVVRERIDGFYYSAAHRCTHVLTAGTVLPVSESLDDMKRLIGSNDAPIKSKENEINGIQTSE